MDLVMAVPDSAHRRARLWFEGFRGARPWRGPDTSEPWSQELRATEGSEQFAPSILHSVSDNAPPVRHGNHYPPLEPTASDGLTSSSACSTTGKI